MTTLPSAAPQKRSNLLHCYQPRLKEIFERHGVKPSQVARAIGKTSNVLTEATYGDRRVSLSTIILLRRYFWREFGALYSHDDFYPITDPEAIP